VDAAFLRAVRQHVGVLTALVFFYLCSSMCMSELLRVLVTFVHVALHAHTSSRSICNSLANRCTSSITS
jgi:hypothetical protein